MSTANAQGGGFQQQALRRFTALMLLRPTWAGELVLGCGLDDAGAALAMATHIAGAVCLSVDADGALVKAAQRSGACDFAVNTLDEALRTMKNEVRQKRALSVGLLGQQLEVFAEVAERGLLPALVVDSGAALLQEPIARLREMSSQVVRFVGGDTSAADADTLVDAWALERGFLVYSVSANGSGDVAALDEQLKTLLGTESGLRRRWLERAPQHFRRERPLSRAVWLNEAEVAALRAAGRTI